MAKTEELLFIETDGACACCGTRDMRTLTTHHIDQSSPKNESYDNKIVLCHNCHHCHHDGKSPTKKELKEIKRRLIVKSLTQVGLNAMKQAYRKPYVVAMPFLVVHLIERQFLKYEEMLSGTREEESNDDNDWLVETASYTITSTGRALLKKWKLN
ncbi:MAG: hypothetical protein WAW02_13970 [Sideroxyarcus sp.]